MVLDLLVESPTYPIDPLGLRPDFALPSRKGEVTVFMPNRDLHSEREVMLVWRDLTRKRTLAASR